MDLKVVGKEVIRVDAEAKVTGKALFPEDLDIEGQAWGKTLRSEIPHGRILNIDISRAEKIDGVLKVFTHKDVELNEHGTVLKDHQVFCDKKVRRIGDPLAFVVAETRELCDQALEAIEVDIEELEPVFDPVYAMTDEAPEIHEGQDNTVYHYKIRKGDIDEGFKKSHVIAENTYTTQMVDHAFLQPESALSFIDEEDRVTVVVATQYPHYDREEIAAALGLEEDEVRVVNANMGGAFGGREDISIQIHMALAAQVLKRPIKTVLSREESFLAHSKRHPYIMNYKTGADEEGKLMAAEIELIGDAGAYLSWAFNVLRKGGVHATGPYEIPNVKVDSYAVYTNNPYTGAMRGFGATQVPIAYEQQMDILAEKLNISPVSIRWKNIFREGSETATGQVLTDSVPLEECMDVVLRGGSND